MGYGGGEGRRRGLQLPEAEQRDRRGRGHHVLGNPVEAGGNGVDVGRARARQDHVAGRRGQVVPIPRGIGDPGGLEFREYHGIGHGVGGGVVAHGPNAPDVRIILVPLLRGSHPVQVGHAAHVADVEIVGGDHRVVAVFRHLVHHFIGENTLHRGKVQAEEPVAGRAVGVGLLRGVEHRAPRLRPVGILRIPGHDDVVDVAPIQHDGLLVPISLVHVKAEQLDDAVAGLAVLRLAQAHEAHGIAIFIPEVARVACPGIQVQQRQRLHALVIVAHGAVYTLFGDLVQHPVFHHEAGGADGGGVLRIGQPAAFAVDLEAFEILFILVPPDGIGGGDVGLAQAVVVLAGVEVCNGARPVAKADIVLPHRILPHGQVVIQIAVAVVLQHEGVQPDVLPLITGIRIQVVSNREAIFIEFLGAGNGEVHEVIVAVDVEIIILPCQDWRLARKPAVLVRLLDDGLGGLPLGDGALVGIQAPPPNPLDILAVDAVPGLPDAEHEGLVAHLGDLVVRSRPVLGAGKHDLPHLRRQRGIAVGLVGGGVDALDFGVVGVHVVREQVGGVALGPDLAADDVPGLREGHEEHRRANGQRDGAGDGQVRGGGVHDAQVDHEVQRGRQLHPSVQEALDADAQLGAEHEADVDGDAVDGVELEAAEGAVVQRKVDRQLRREARRHAQRKAHVQRHRPHGIPEGPAVAVADGDARAAAEADVGGGDVGDVLVQFPAAGGHREDAHVDGGFPHEAEALGLVVVLGHVVIGLVFGKPALLLHRFLGLVGPALVLLLPFFLDLFDVVLKDGLAHEDDHAAAGVDGQVGKITLEGQLEFDVDFHHGDLEADGQALAQHVGEDAAVWAGALVQGFFRGALLGGELAGEHLALGGVLAEHEGGPLAQVGLGREQALPGPLEHVYAVLIGLGLGPALLQSGKAAVVGIVAHQQLPVPVVPHAHLDLELIVVHRGIDHVVFRMHDVLAREGHQVDVGRVVRVGGVAVGGSADGGQGAGVVLALFQVHILDDEVTEALGGGVGRHVQVEHVELVQYEFVDGHHGDSVFGGIGQRLGVRVQRVLHPYFDARHGYGMLCGAGLQHDADLVLRQHGDLRVGHVVGNHARRHGQPVGAGCRGRDPRDLRGIGLRRVGFAQQPGQPVAHMAVVLIPRGAGLHAILQALDLVLPPGGAVGDGLPVLHDLPGGLLDPGRIAHLVGIEQGGVPLLQPSRHLADDVRGLGQLVLVPAQRLAQILCFEVKRLRLREGVVIGIFLIDVGLVLAQLVQREGGLGEQLVDGPQVGRQLRVQPVPQLGGVPSGIGPHACMVGPVAVGGQPAGSQSRQGIGPGQLILGKHPADGSQGVKGHHLDQQNDQKQRGQQLFHLYSSRRFQSISISAVPDGFRSRNPPANRLSGRSAFPSGSSAGRRRSTAPAPRRSARAPRRAPRHCSTVCARPAR